MNRFQLRFGEKTLGIIGEKNCWDELKKRTPRLEESKRGEEEKKKRGRSKAPIKPDLVCTVVRSCAM